MIRMGGQVDQVVEEELVEEVEEVRERLVVLEDTGTLRKRRACRGTVDSELPAKILTGVESNRVTQNMGIGFHGLDCPPILTRVPQRTASTNTVCKNLKSRFLKPPTAMFSDSTYL